MGGDESNERGSGCIGTGMHIFRSHGEENERQAGTGIGTGEMETGRAKERVKRLRYRLQSQRGKDACGQKLMRFFTNGRTLDTIPCMCPAGPGA